VLLPRFPPLQSGAAFSSPAFSTPAFLLLPRFPVPRFQRPLLAFESLIVSVIWFRLFHILIQINIGHLIYRSPFCVLICTSCKNYPVFGPPCILRSIPTCTKWWSRSDELTTTLSKLFTHMRILSSSSIIRYWWKIGHVCILRVQRR